MPFVGKRAQSQPQNVGGKTGRPPKYSPIPQTLQQIRPMLYDEASHHIRYFKGGLNYIHYSEIINDALTIPVTKPTITEFLNDAAEAIDALFIVTHFEGDQTNLFIGIWGSRRNNSTSFLNPKAVRQAQFRQSITTETVETVEEPGVSIPQKVNSFQRVINQASPETQVSSESNLPEGFIPGYDPRLNFYDDHMQDEYNSGQCLWDEDKTPPQWVDRNSKDGAPAIIPDESLYKHLNEWAVGSAKHVNPDGTQNHAMLLEPDENSTETYFFDPNDVEDDEEEGDKALYQMMLDSGKPISNFGTNGARLKAKFPHMKPSKQP